MITRLAKASIAQTPRGTQGAVVSVASYSVQKEKAVDWSPSTLMRLLGFLACLLSVCTFASCASGGRVTDHNPCTKSQAIAAAKAELEKGGGRGRVEAHASRDDGRWTVVIWALPATPGGFVVVHVSDEGKVIDILPGD